LEDLGIGRKIILERILTETRWEGVDWISWPKLGTIGGIL